MIAVSTAVDRIAPSELGPRCPALRAGYMALCGT